MKTKTSLILTALLAAATGSHAAINAGQKLQINFANGWYPGLGTTNAATPGGDPAGFDNWNYYTVANTNFNTTTSNSTDMVDIDGNTISNINLTAAGWGGENWNNGLAWAGNGTNDTDLAWDQSVNFWWAWESSTEAITIHGLDTNLFYNIKVYALNPQDRGTYTQTEITLNGSPIDGARQGDRWYRRDTPFRWYGMTASEAGELALGWNASDPDNPVLNAITIEATATQEVDPAPAPDPVPETGPLALGQTFKINFSNWFPGDAGHALSKLNWNYYNEANSDFNQTTTNNTAMLDFNSGTVITNVRLTAGGWSGVDWNEGVEWPGEPGAGTDLVRWDQYVNFWQAEDSSTEAVTLHGLDTNLTYNVRLYALYPAEPGTGTDLEITLNGSMIDGGLRGDRWNANATPFSWSNMTASAAGELAFSWNATDPDNTVLNTIVIDVVSPQSDIPAIGNIAVEILPGANNLVITWATGEGFGYALESKPDLATVNWTTNTTITGVDGTISVTTAVDQAQSFYRVRGE